MAILHEQLFRKLYKLIPDLDKIEQGEGIKLTSEGFMDLCVDVLQKTSEKTIISLAHYYKMNGDLVPDPDMEVAIYPKPKMAEALTFQDTYSYSVVYPEEGKVNLKAKSELNSFLNKWLNNLKMQGHKAETPHRGRQA